MAFAVLGVPTQYDLLGSVEVPVIGVSGSSIGINRNPLLTRLPRAPLTSWSFRTSTRKYTPGQTTMNNGGALASGGGSVVVTDATIFQINDVIEIDNETMLVTAVTPSTNTLTLSRGYAGTTAASHNDASVVYKIGNSSTGSETGRAGISQLPVQFDQYAQTFLHPYHMGGAQAAHTSTALPPGVPNALGQARYEAIQRCGDDVERSLIYGRGVSISGGASKPAMVGFRSYIATNNVTAPINGGAYKPSDFIRDVIAAPTKAGGMVDLVLAASNFQVGLAKWGMALQRLDAGATRFGVSIDLFSAPFINDVMFLYHPLLRDGTVIGLSSSQVRLRVVREMFDKPRGSGGDAYEGDIIGEYSLELDNESFHSYVSGVTGFAVES